MPGNFKKDDLRITKTNKALRQAFITLVKKCPFNRVTVHALCEEALTSRATFYAHFYDKYDLLEHILATVTDDIENNPGILLNEANASRIIQDNIKIIQNLIEEADTEVMTLLHTFIASIFNIFANKKQNRQGDGYLVSANFFSGGVLNLLQWQIKNKFPLEIQYINTFLFAFLKLMAEQEQDK